MRVAYIEWTDASIDRGPVATADISRLVEITAAGLLVEDEPDYVSIAIDCSGKGKQWREVHTIPRVNIRRFACFDVPDIEGEP